MSLYLFILTQEDQNGCHQDDEKEGCTFHVAWGVMSVVAYARDFAFYRPLLEGVFVFCETSWVI